jgi:phosphoribosyl 1,2-cyclic phosphodiesterase
MKTTISKPRKPESTPDYNLAVCVLASGSKGNAVYISDGTTAILVDAGLSGIEIERRLKSMDLSPQSLDAIIVSHEHADHIHGVGVLARRFQLPVYINRKTTAVAGNQLGKIGDIRYFECGAHFSVNGLAVRPFSISHDAEDPAGFTFHRNGTKIGIATDLGVATSVVKTHLKGCDLLILEANHDTAMLMEGPYPWPLKQRIRSRTGHLSNEDSKILLKELQHESLSHVILAHLSETNNTPQKALDCVGEALVHSGIRIDVAVQDRCTDIVEIK